VLDGSLAPRFLKFRHFGNHRSAGDGHGRIVLGALDHAGSVGRSRHRAIWDSLRA
jgi:hypothetical protein